MTAAYQCIFLLYVFRGFRKENLEPAGHVSRHVQTAQKRADRTATCRLHSDVQTAQRRADRTETCRPHSDVQSAQRRAERTETCRPHRDVQTAQRRADRTATCRPHRDVQTARLYYVGMGVILSSWLPIRIYVVSFLTMRGFLKRRKVPFELSRSVMVVTSLER